MEATGDAQNRDVNEKESRWQTLKIVYNSSREERPVALDGDGWKILCERTGQLAVEDGKTGRGGNTYCSSERPYSGTDWGRGTIRGCRQSG